MTFKELFSKKTASPVPVAINKIWLWEIIAAAIFLIFFLFIDFLVYQNITSQETGISPENAGGVAHLKKNNLIEAGKKIKAYQNFLQNPQYPLIKNPF